MVTAFPEGCDVAAVDTLTVALDGLAEAMWETYVHPAAQYGDPDEVNSDAWHWDGERRAFPDALAAVRSPNLPEDGMLTVSYCRVEESGHRVGRFVQALGLGEDLIFVIAREVEREQAAIEAAEAGDLSGRAAQAVALSRIGASPTQIHVAWNALLADPLGCHEELLTGYEPSAASVAAASCLRCAAQITAEVSGDDWTDVLVESNNIEAFPVLTPTAVLALIDQGATEREAVTRLLVEAHAVSEGHLSDLEQLAAVVEQTRHLQQAGVGEEHLDLRLTVLDPRRPARDLLEDLLTGIDGCFTLWREHQDDPDRQDDAAEPSEDDSDDDRKWSEKRERLEEKFVGELRTAMTTAGAPL